MANRTIDAAFAAVLIVLGAYVMYEAVGYHYLDQGRPGAGFFPFWVGGGLILLSAANLVRSLKGLENVTGVFDKKGLAQSALIAIAIIVFLFVVSYIGMLIGSSLLILAISLIIRPKWDRSFAMKITPVVVLFPLFAHVLFSDYLGVPLVQGVFGF